MRNPMNYTFICCITVLATFVSAVAQPSSPDPAVAKAAAFIARASADSPDRLLHPKTKVTGTSVTREGVRVTLSREAVSQPWRPETVAKLKEGLARELGLSSTPGLEVLVGDRAIDEFVPPFYRAGRKPREGQSTAPPHMKAPLRRNASGVAPRPAKGLADRHIVVWASHGWLFDAKNRLRWEWQRPRMFTTVEDLLTMSVINPYLIPMLENAGAVVINCRERDFQTREVVVDDADTTGSGEFRTEGGGFRASSVKGFRNGLAPYPAEMNPHQEGTTHECAKGNPGSVARWTPRIPEDGDYAVYVSYASFPDSSPEAAYTVRHAGGATTFLVNQQMAGNSWVYLGNFRFRAGSSSDAGCVELSTGADQSGGRLSADAVKFGGGMGDTLRNGAVSGYPRYAEAARYWLPYCGVDPKLVYAFGKNAGNEYTEDYISRGEYVNYLVGAPRGPNRQRDFQGLGVPVDLAFGLHTDAGITTGVIGTLAIHTIADDVGKTRFPDGRDRMLNRDLADLIQTQIVDDIRANYCSDWTRRELADKDYSESRRPNVPAVLFEVLSHQNYDDMKFMLDPRFRRDMARSIYKGMLKFLGTEYGFEPVVTPLPPDHVAVETIGPGRVRVSWRPVDDPLEPSAGASGFVVYKRTGDGGFDNGIAISESTRFSAEFVLPDVDAIHSFRATATNAGGESMPSAVVAVRTGKPGAPRALIVDAFDRISPPALVSMGQDSVPGSIANSMREGADRAIDRGVGDNWSVGLTGDQHDFDRSHAWLGNDTPFTNDHPGHGSSYADLEATRELGNSSDFVARHGSAFAACGWAFDSASAAAVSDPVASTTLARYRVVDWLLGEQRTVTPPPAFDGKAGAADRMKPEFRAWQQQHQEVLRNYLAGGGRLLVSGVYVATDLVLPGSATAADRAFLKETLQCAWMTDRASRTNSVEPSSTDGPFKRAKAFRISSGTGEDGVYGVESPGGIEGLPKQPPAVLRYSDGKTGAAVASDAGGGKRIVLAFPFECVVGAETRATLMKAALDYLDR